MQNRREFLSSAAAFGAAVWLAACGDDEENGSSGNCTENGTNVSIADNHGHTLMVSKEDVMAAVEKTYDIRGSSGHTHQATVTEANFTTLQGNESVEVTSAQGGDGHRHAITVSCA